MKQLRLIIASLLVIMSVGLTSCNQENPSEALLFTGKYEGTVTFDKLGDGTSPILATGVEVSVFKIGESYTFRFSKDGIPTLSGVKMQKGENSLVTLQDDKAGVITITGETLNIGYKNQVGTWTVVNAKRKK